ncbi:NEP1-interacting protein 1 [Hibiscus syriacus]|uniref:NEP1-interacting protein 1 n=1 Tax=Hibiscus syriacus TaxID=106335 RepID=A0A6A2X5L3_HIBSY|nr:NEP1-interacting protein 1 [Hibiscus syriacus]
MDFYSHPSRFSVYSSSLFGNFIERIKFSCNFAVSVIIGNIFSAILTFFFALVGTLLGAMTGALIGQETESGFVRGAAVGAISGAVFSIEVFESSLVLWQSDESRIGCLLYLIDVIASLLSGRLVREQIGPAMLSAVQSQMGAAETTFGDFQNIFDIGGTKGLAGDLVEKIPKIKITNNNNIDSSGRRFHALFAFRTFSSEKRCGACHSAITCSTCLA